MSAIAPKKQGPRSRPLSQTVRDSLTGFSGHACTGPAVGASRHQAEVLARLVVIWRDKVVNADRVALRGASYVLY